MNARKFNWPIWAGFLLSLIAFLSYPFVFVWFPVTRDFPWANLLLFALAIALLVVGVRRAFALGRGHQAGPLGVVDRPRPRRSKITASILANSQHRGFRILYLFHLYFGEALARLS